MPSETKHFPEPTGNTRQEERKWLGWSVSEGTGKGKNDFLTRAVRVGGRETSRRTGDYVDDRAWGRERKNAARQDNEARRGTPIHSLTNRPFSRRARTCQGFSPLWSF